MPHWTRCLKRLLSLLSALSHEQSFAGHPPADVMSELESDRHSVLASQASRWEMAIEVGLGRLSVDLAVLEKRLTYEGFQWLAISNEHLLEVARLETIAGACDLDMEKYRLLLNCVSVLPDQ